MINYMQSNQTSRSDTNNIAVINDDIYNKITSLLHICPNESSNGAVKDEKKINDFSCYIYEISQLYNIDIKSIIKDYFNYLIRYKPEYINSKILTIIETIIHNSDINTNYLINYLFNYNKG